MIQIKDAIIELGFAGGWILRGQPTNETEFNEMLRMLILDSDGNTIETTDYPDGLTWGAVSAKKTELENAEPLKLLRVERNAKLAETDWTQGRDVTLTNDADWQTYRQALRDITDTYTSLDDVVWPEKP
jgi:hypothetical protein